MKVQDLQAKKRTIILILLVSIILSVFVVAPFATSDLLLKQQIEHLSKKQSSITKVIISAAAASIIIALVPDDWTSPIANEVADFGSYLILAQIIVLFEKYLCGVSGFLVFRILIPAALLCLALYFGFNKQHRFFMVLAVRMIIVSIIAFSLVPVSNAIDGYLENTFHISRTVNKVLPQDAVETEIETEIEEKNFFEKAKSFFSGIGNGVSNISSQAQEILQNFMDAVVVLLLTDFVIPIVGFMIIGYVSKAFFSFVRQK